MIERGLCTCRAVPRMEGGVFYKEVRMEGGWGSGGPASHTRTFPDLVPPPGTSPKRSTVHVYPPWAEGQAIFGGKKARVSNFFFCQEQFQVIRGIIDHRIYCVWPNM